MTSNDEDAPPGLTALSEQIRELEEQLDMTQSDEVARTGRLVAHLRD